MTDVKLTREQIELIRKAMEVVEQPTAVALCDMVLTLELEAADLRERLARAVGFVDLVADLAIIPPMMTEQARQLMMLQDKAKAIRALTQKGESNE